MVVIIIITALDFPVGGVSFYLVSTCVCIVIKEVMCELLVTHSQTQI